MMPVTIVLSLANEWEIVKDISRLYCVIYCF